MHSDFVMIIANLCKINLEEVIVAQAGSDLDKDLMKRAPTATYPILETDEGILLCDSIAIASYLVTLSKTELLGKSDIERAQVD